MGSSSPATTRSRACLSLVGLLSGGREARADGGEREDDPDADGE